MLLAWCSLLSSVSTDGKGDTAGQESFPTDDVSGLPPTAKLANGALGIHIWIWSLRSPPPGRKHNKGRLANGSTATIAFLVIPRRQCTCIRHSRTNIPGARTSRRRRPTRFSPLQIDQPSMPTTKTYLASITLAILKQASRQPPYPTHLTGRLQGARKAPTDARRLQAAFAKIGTHGRPRPFHR